MKGAVDGNTFIISETRERSIQLPIPQLGFLMMMTCCSAGC